jgi:hypothetical protein
MCVIIVVPEGHDITQQIMENAIERNPHGWGMSVRLADGTFKIAKGFSEREAWKKWQKLGNEGERVFHARVATHGGISIQNLHPFDASVGEEGRLFYHNGTVNSIPQFNESRSDSWHVAQFLRSFPTNKRLIDGINELARKEVSRFVFCTPKESYYFGSGWIKREGVLYSNGSALGAVTTRRRAWAGGMLHEEGVVSDTHCEGFKYDPETKFYKPDPNYKPPTEDYDAAKEAEAAKAVPPFPSDRGGYPNCYGREDWEWYERDSGGSYRSKHKPASLTAFPASKREPLHEFGPGKYPVVPPPLTEEQRKAGLCYRYANENGEWWEDHSKDGVTALVKVNGPHPGTVIYRQPNRMGVGVVMGVPGSRDEFRVLGRYDFRNLHKEVVEMFNLKPFHVREADEATAKEDSSATCTDAATGKQYTLAEWEAICAADDILAFNGLTSAEIVGHFRANGGSLYPLPQE